MLVTTKELLRVANAQNKAIGAFNITGLESLRSVILAAEKLQEPVIIQFSQVHDKEQIMDLNTIGPIMVLEADKANVPIAVHLDHGVDLPFIDKALKMGFTSIMYSGSSLSYDEHIAYTNMAVQLARKYGASVEAEIGEMKDVELDTQDISRIYTQHRSMFTDPLIAQDFVEKTGVDSLSCFFGSLCDVHTTDSHFNFELIKELDDTVNVPIVMPSGCRICEADYHTAILNGIRKVNYYIDLEKSGAEAILTYCNKNIDHALFHDMANIAMNAMQKNVEDAIRIFQHRKDK